KADHALTFNPDHSMGAVHPDKAKLFQESNAKDEVLRVDRQILASGYTNGDYIRDVTIIHYRSQDEAGTVLEGLASCSIYIGQHERWGDSPVHFPRANGYTMHEWVNRSVAKSTADSAAMLK
ncbi:MAG: hypothetical protein ACOH2H_25250, partial [Cypionkella sp.]